MNHAVTSRGEILEVCRQIAASEGLSAISMRRVAESCRMALGSVYNYFPSKDALLAASVELIFEELFRTDEAAPPQPFPAYFRALYLQVRRGAARYPGFFRAHSAQFLQPSVGRETMERYFDRLKAEMAQALRADPAVRPDAFSGPLPEAAFLDFVLTGLLTLLQREEPDCAAFAEILRRVLGED